MKNPSWGKEGELRARKFVFATSMPPVYAFFFFFWYAWMIIDDRYNKHVFLCELQISSNSQTSAEGGVVSRVLHHTRMELQEHERAKTVLRARP